MWRSEARGPKRSGPTALVLAIPGASEVAEIGSDADRVTLELGSERVPAATFGQGVEAFLTLIREVAASVTGKREAIRWYVAVSAGSARVHAYPEPVEVEHETVRTVARTVQRGVSLLYTHAERPPHFNDRALEAAKTLAEIATRGDDETVPVRVTADGASTTVATTTVVNVETILGPHTEAIGSIEGRIDTISERGKRKFFVYDALTDRPVRCYFSSSLFDEVVDAFKARRRVVVAGLVRYRRDGEPVSVRVEDLRSIEGKRLPSFEDVRGILRDAE